MNPLKALVACVVAVSAAPGVADEPAPAVTAIAPAAVYSGSGQLRLGEPVGVAVDFNGRAVIADGSPGRVLRWDESAGAHEFQEPSGGFYPSDVAVRGFFVYAVDEPGRRIVRFDDTGAFRDVLLNFEELDLGRRASPYSLAVDDGGRFAVTDIENHQVLLFDSYLSLQAAFGNYGSFAGQLDTPMGISFSRAGDVVVADTGNRRVQVFSDGGGLERTVPAKGTPNPLSHPRRAALDGDGRVYVADPGAGAGTGGVFVFDADGRLERSIVPSGAEGFTPTDLARSRAGVLFVTDEASRSLFVFKGI